MGERTGSGSCPWSDYRLMVFTSPSYPIFPLIQRPSQSIHHNDRPLHLHNLILSIFTVVTSQNTLNDQPRQFINPRRPVLVLVSDSINTTIQVPQSMRSCLYIYHFIFSEYLYSIPFQIKQKQRIES
jgi:hypothetical protein